MNEVEVLFLSPVPCIPIPCDTPPTSLASRPELLTFWARDQEERTL